MLIGVVGKPSCGKSTFFKAATLSNVDIANYPFTTIKPNHAVGFVKITDPAVQFGKHSNPRIGYIMDDWRFVAVDLIDVAGLVPGAHKGEGMGSQFLSDLNQADILIHVIDISGSVNGKGEQCEPLSYDPLNDVEFLETELDFWYLDIIKRGWDKFSRTIQQEKSQTSKAIGKQLSGLGVDEDLVKEAIQRLSLNPEKPSAWTDEEIFKLARYLRIKTKPMMIAANKVDVPGAEKNIERLKEKFPDYTIVPCSAECELALKEADKHEVVKYIPGEDNFEILNPEKLSEKQKIALEFIRKNILEKNHTTGVQDVINKAIFEKLNYMALFPGGVTKLEDSDGNVIPDCFLMPVGTTALEFAYKLHTDFGKNFIRAIDVKTKMTVGKEHVLNDGDIVEIVADK